MARSAIFERRALAPVGPAEGRAPRVVRGVAALVDVAVFYPLALVSLAAGVVAAGGAVGAAVVGSRAGPLLQNLGGLFKATGVTVAAGLVAGLAGVAALLVLLTQWSMLASSGQTLGKRLMGVRIVDERGVPAGFIRALLLRRWLFNAVYASLGTVVTAWVPFVGWAWWCLDVLPLFGEERRCLHDHVAVTDVRWVRASGPGAARVVVGLALVGATVGGVAWFVGPEQWQALATAVGWRVPVPPVVPAPVTPPAPAPAPASAVVVPPPAVVPVVVPTEVVDAGVAVPEAPSGPRGPVAWTYEDAAGVTQVVQDWAQVPEAFRARARAIR